MIENTDLTITEMVAQYQAYADRYYVCDGVPTGEAMQVDHATRPLKAMYGSTLVADFGPKALKQVRETMIAAGLARRTINSRIDRVKRAFSWAVSEELAPPSLAHALATVHGLRPGRTDALEKLPVKPVDDFGISSTVRHLTPVVADMVRFQRLTGCRPGEVCSLRPCDINRAGDVWVYQPPHHKMAYRGQVRQILIGPRAQAIIEPYLKRARDSFCFSPRESARAGLEKRQAARRNPQRRFEQQPAIKADPTRAPGSRYSIWTYRRAIHRGCKRAFVKNWSPNQLRHTAATEIRQQYGLEAAQVILGHSAANVTQIYAERNRALGEDVIRKIG